MKKFIKPALHHIKSYSSARDEFKGYANTFLDANENPFDKETIFNRYPDPYQHQLKKAIGNLKNISAENIFLGNGSDEPIDILMRLCCNAQSQDYISIFSPTYGMYQVSADINLVKIKEHILTDDFDIDEKQYIAEYTPHNKITFICSPNNPSGNCITMQKIEMIIQHSPYSLVVIDEAYIDFSSQPSCISLLHKYDNVVILQTFSKAWGLAGLRLGMAFAHPQIVEWMNKIKPPYNINAYTQQFVLKKIEQEKDTVKNQIDLILQQRENLFKILQQLPIITKVYPSQANFLLIKMAIDATHCYHLLTQAGIVVRNRSSLPKCQNCLRITIGTKQENEHLISTLLLLHKQNKE